jgi:hypothetical protein
MDVVIMDVVIIMMVPADMVMDMVMEADMDTDVVMVVGNIECQILNAEC